MMQYITLVFIVVSFIVKTTYSTETSSKKSNTNQSYIIDLDLKNCSSLIVFRSENLVHLKHSVRLTYRLFLLDENNRYSSEMNPFLADTETGVVFFTNINDLKPDFLYNLKLAAFRRSNLSSTFNEIYLKVKVKLSEHLDCLMNKNLQPGLVKFLFADSILSYDFNDIVFNIENNENGSITIPQKQSVFISENTLVDSFICYILVKSSLALEIEGFGKENFKLEQVNFGSTSLLQALPVYNENNSKAQVTTSPVISLYSLKLGKCLDREQKESYDLEFGFKINKINFLVANLNIIVTDINDNEPKFEKLNYTFEFFENNNRNFCIGSIKAIDNDAINNTFLKYYLVDNSLRAYSSNANGKSTLINLSKDILKKLIHLNENTGQICVLEVLNRECYAKFIFNVAANDSASPFSLTSTQNVTVEINLLDVNDNLPIFYLQNIQDNSNECSFEPKAQKPSSAQSDGSYQKVFEFYLLENSPQDTFIAWLKAYDLDQNDNSLIDYYLTILDNENQYKTNRNLYSVKNSNLFYIDSNGIVRNSVTFNSTNNSANNQIYLLKIVAKDRGNTVSLSNEIFIKVKIITEIDKRALKITLEPNSSVFYFRNEEIRPTNNPIVKINAHNIHTKDDHDNKNLSYQLVPMFINSGKEYGEKDRSEMGENCSQIDFIRYFTLNNRGEISFSKNSNMNINYQRNTMICFVSINVLDLSKPYQLSSSVELTFILYNKPTNYESEEVFKQKLLSRALALKKNLFSSDTLVRKIIDNEGATANYQISKKVPQFEENNKTYLYYSSSLVLVCLVTSAFIIFIVRSCSPRLDKPIDDSNQLEYEGTYKCKDSCTVKIDISKRAAYFPFSPFISRIISFGNKQQKGDKGSDCSTSSLASKNNLNEFLGNLSSIEDILAKNKSIRKAYSNSDDESTNHSPAKDMMDYEVNDIKRDHTALSGDKKDTKTLDLIPKTHRIYDGRELFSFNSTDDANINNYNFSQQTKTNNSELMEAIDLCKNKLQSSFLADSLPSLNSLDKSFEAHPQLCQKNTMNNACSNTISKKISTLGKASCFSSSEVSANSLNTSSTSFLVNKTRDEKSKSNESSPQSNGAKKIQCGIYQVSNQILIDYDDNTTYSIYAKNKSVSLKNNDQNTFKPQNSNLYTNTNELKFKEPLQRFEKIYYEDQKNFLTQSPSSTVANQPQMIVNYGEDSTIKFGSFV